MATKFSINAQAISCNQLRNLVLSLQKHGFVFTDVDSEGFKFVPMSGSYQGLLDAMVEQYWVKQGDDLFPANMNDGEGWTYYIQPKNAGEMDYMVSISPETGAMYVA